MNHKNQQEFTDQSEGIEHSHSFTDSSPSSTTPSPLSTTPMVHSHLNATDQWNLPYVLTQNPSSSLSMAITTTTMSPSFYAPTPTVLPSITSRLNTGYFASINGLFPNSAPMQSPYANPDFEYTNYAPLSPQTPPLPLPVQRIASQRKHKTTRMNRPVKSASPTTTQSCQKQSPSQNKRRKKGHDSPKVCSSETSVGSSSPHSSSGTPLPSPTWHYPQENRTVEDVERDTYNLEVETEEEEHQNIESTPSSSPPPPQDLQQLLKTVKTIETDLSFLGDECATILMMLESLRNAFLADEEKQQNVKKKKDWKLAMEREMRIAYDDLMLQVRQLERKVERLERQSKLICERG